MIGFAPFADIVEQQREGEQLRRVQFLQSRAEPPPAGAGRFEQRLHAADRQQRVLVDGVLVVEVADDAAVNRLELREDAVEQPAVVHLGEASVEPDPRRQQAPELQAIAFGGDEIIGRAAVHVLLDEGQGLTPTSRTAARAQS